MWRQVLVLIALAACDRGGGGNATLAPMPAGAVRSRGPHFTIDAAPSAGSVLIELTALDGYKVNKDYPFRFLPAAGWTLEGAPAIQHAPPRMRMTVRARREQPATPFAGTLKLSVCNDDECLVEEAAISVNMP